MPFPIPNLETLAKQISVKSAVNPALFFCLIISLPAYATAAMVNVWWLSIAFFAVGSLPIALFIISYLYLLLTNPDYLRSEDHQWRMQALRLLGDKDNPLGASAAHVVSITNPSLPSPTPTLHE